MDIELELFRLVEIGVETDALAFGPVWRQWEAVHHASQPVKLDAVLVNVQQKDIFQYVFRCSLNVLP